jgi:metallo-beta-lactamase family protein
MSGVGEVTGSNFLVESLPAGQAGDGVKILIDCGLVQGLPRADTENRDPFKYDPSAVDYLLVTHAHLDHIGRIPKLIKDGFRGRIFSTGITKELAEPMLEDARSVMDTEARERGILPLYEKKDIETALSIWEGMPYHRETELSGGFSFYLKDAGHILGSAMIELRRNGKKIVFTGDLGNSPAPLLRDTEIVDDAEYLVMESVYGDREHEPQGERDKRFAHIVKNTVKRGGTVVIPAFSLERTQNILYSLNNLVEGHGIPSVPVFVDSPLAIKVTEIYKAHEKDFNEKVREEIREGDDIFSFPKLEFTETSRDSDHIKKIHGPKIILAGSGMSAGGRVTKHEKEYLPDTKNTILLVGYQSLGTLGRRLEEGERTVIIEGQKVRVRAQIENIRGFSSHKDSSRLLEFAAKDREKAKQIFVVMGEPKASLFLTQRLRDYENLPAIVPERNKPYELDL